MAPSASVVVPAWNRAGSIAGSVSSVLAQAFEDFEVVVVDDGSADSTAEVVESMPDPRVRLVRTPHQGVSAARNAGAAAAHGTVLLFLDSDDEALPGWLEELSSPILSGHADLAISGWQLAGADGSSWEWLPEQGRLSADDLAPRFLAGSWAVRRDVFEQVGGFDTRITYGENTEIALRLLNLSALRLAVVGLPLLRVLRKGREGPDRAAQARNARLVLDKYRHSHSTFPKTWASYQTLVGVDEARNRRRLAATRHFLAAVRADPRDPRRFSRLGASLVPVLRSLGWPPT